MLQSGVVAISIVDVLRLVISRLRRNGEEEEKNKWSIWTRRRRKTNGETRRNKKHKKTKQKDKKKGDKIKRIFIKINLKGGLLILPSS